MMQCVAPGSSSYVSILLAVAAFVPVAAVVLACLAHITPNILLAVVQPLAHNWKHQIQTILYASFYCR